ncbi:LLM class flavin-dependent oxidoreductase [Pedobacter hartonius]|uniref:Luciferase family oxidoreductase, group 1 n=1 Tax=Pedobacter hartonius TaxID=425514 RepID=A0A1H3ZUF0_9SPHI|nr:LLM class flavin-dependent oxidoreductase [Pedobacter hartonius]SEA27396.1 luciferase family oxidoreductase, group 1 [Pedobacter hartonius]
MKTKKIRLSILDHSLIHPGNTARQAVMDTIAVAKLADRLGYTRFWVSEHHNTDSFASSTPEVLIAHLAGETTNMRIGAGGVMLPNYSALKVAENFRALEVLFPGRIDLGIGRASGADPKTAGLLNPYGKRTDEEFAEQLKDLVGYLHYTASDQTDTEKVYATPRTETSPPLWLLSMGGESALAAARMGTGLSFSHFMNPVSGLPGVRAYRENFRPSAEVPEPKLILGISIFCSEDRDLLMRTQATVDQTFLELTRTGKATAFSYDEVKDLSYTAEEQEIIASHRPRILSGTPDEIEQKLDQLINEFRPDELMLTTFTEGFEERIKSFELLADMYLKS